MTQQSHQHPHQHDHHVAGHGSDETGLADLLDLDAEVLGSYLDEMTGWIGQLAQGAPGTVVDLGAGTGTGSLALARRFGSAEVIAIDRSDLMLDRLTAAAHAQGLADRLRTVQADVDLGWPEVGQADVVWAASSLHHVADPDRVLGDVHGALAPGGLLVVIEMESLPRFLPDDVGLGRPGLESRCHEAAAQAHWNAHPDWRPHLERAGFEIIEQRTRAIEASPASSVVGRYAHTVLRGMRGGLADRLAADDLAALDHLLADDGPASVLQRRDLTVHASRTAWLARRP